MAELEDGCDCTAGSSVSLPPTEEQLAWLFRMRAQAEGREIRVNVPAEVVEIIDVANR